MIGSFILTVKLNHHQMYLKNWFFLKVFKKSISEIVRYL